MTERGIKWGLQIMKLSISLSMVVWIYTLKNYIFALSPEAQKEFYAYWQGQLWYYEILGAALVFVGIWQAYISIRANWGTIKERIARITDDK